MTNANKKLTVGVHGMGFSSYVSLQKQLAQASCLLKPSYIESCKRIAQAFEPIRSKQLAIFMGAASHAASASRFAEITAANKRLVDLFDHSRLTDKWLKDLQNVHRTWIQAIKPKHDVLAAVKVAASLSLANAARTAALSNRFFSRTDFAKIHASYSLPEMPFMQVKNACADMMQSFRGLAESIKPFPKLTTLPSFVLPGASREIFTSGYAVATISPEGDEGPLDEDLSIIEEIKAETQSCEDILRGIDQELLRPLIGARDALESRSVDRTRHLLASLRELWNHILRRLAPDASVLNWVPELTDEYIHEGKPTRRARVLYVCRSVNHGPFSNFVVQDTKGLVELIQFLNRVHELGNTLTQKQLEALMIRAESWLVYILKISEENG